MVPYQVQCEHRCVAAKTWPPDTENDTRTNCALQLMDNDFDGLFEILQTRSTFELSRQQSCFRHRNRTAFAEAKRISKHPEKQEAGQMDGLSS